MPRSPHPSCTRRDRRLVEAGLKDVLASQRAAVAAAASHAAAGKLHKATADVATGKGVVAGKEQQQQQQHDEAAARGDEDNDTEVTDEQRIAADEARRARAAEAAKARAVKAAERRSAMAAEDAKGSHRITTFFVTSGGSA